METSFLSVLAASSLAALVTSIGIYTIRNFAERGQRNTTYFICFAAPHSTTSINLALSALASASSLPAIGSARRSGAARGAGTVS